jgi:tRNA1Val (adenine37-N6)-methyltransferase
MKVTTDACLFGAWAAREVASFLAITGRKSEAGSPPRRWTGILDIGAGTGLLSMMLAQKVHVPIDGIEIDETTAEQATENIIASPWKDRINIVHGDIKDVSLPHDRYDVIISNPPFYENELASPDAKKNIAHHDEGLLLPELLQVINKTLVPDGIFCLLLPYKRMEEVEQLMQRNHLVINHITLVRQSTQHDYFRILISGIHSSDRNVGCVKDEIAIKNEKNEYTGEFTGLLKDYYLHL